MRLNNKTFILRIIQRQYNRLSNNLAEMETKRVFITQTVRPVNTQLKYSPTRHQSIEDYSMGTPTRDTDPWHQQVGE